MMGPVSLETPELPHPSRHVGHHEEMLSMTQEAAVTRGQVCRPLDLELPASQTLSSQCCSQTAQSVVFLSQELVGDGGVGQGGRQEWWLAAPRGAGSPSGKSLPEGLEGPSSHLLLSRKHQAYWAFVRRAATGPAETPQLETGGQV